MRNSSQGKTMSKSFYKDSDNNFMQVMKQYQLATVEIKENLKNNHKRGSSWGGLLKKITSNKNTINYSLMGYG